MATLFIYNQAESRMEICPYEGNLPYVWNSRLSAAEFAGREHTDIAWTDRRLLEAYDSLCCVWGGPLKVNHAFCRIKSRMHKAQSAHYAGLAMDIGRGMKLSDLGKLRALAVKTGDWGYVEPSHIAPTWVHVELRLGSAPGYPALSAGDRSVYCFVLQDALKAIGYEIPFTGIMDASTVNALKKFQMQNALQISGKANRKTWKALFEVAEAASLPQAKFTE
jgi:hypothetical protein